MRTIRNFPRVVSLIALPMLLVCWANVSRAQEDELCKGHDYCKSVPLFHGDNPIKVEATISTATETLKLTPQKTWDVYPQASVAVLPGDKVLFSVTVTDTDKTHCRGEVMAHIKDTKMSVVIRERYSSPSFYKRVTTVPLEPKYDEKKKERTWAGEWPAGGFDFRSGLAFFFEGEVDDVDCPDHKDADDPAIMIPPWFPGEKHDEGTFYMWALTPPVTVEVTRVPEYFYRNTKYYVPLQFKINGLGNHVSVNRSTAEVVFYAAQHVVQIAPIAMAQGDGFATLENGKHNIYTLWMSPSRFPQNVRGGTTDGVLWQLWRLDALRCDQDGRPTSGPLHLDSDPNSDRKTAALWTKVFADRTVEVVDIGIDALDNPVDIDFWSDKHNQTLMNNEGAGKFEWFKSNDGDLPPNPEDRILEQGTLYKAGFNDGTHEGKVIHNMGIQSTSYLLDDKNWEEDDEWVRAYQYMTDLNVYWGVSYGYRTVSELGGGAVKGMDLNQASASGCQLNSHYGLTIKLEGRPRPEDQKAILKIVNAACWGALEAGATIATAECPLWSIAAMVAIKAAHAGVDEAIDRGVDADYAKTGPKVQGQIAGALLLNAPGDDTNKRTLAMFPPPDGCVDIWDVNNKTYRDKEYPLAQLCAGSRVGGTYVLRWRVDSKVEVMSRARRTSMGKADVILKAQQPLSVAMTGATVK